MLFGKRKRIVKRILIVEDEPLTAFDNEVMLRDLGYDVVDTLDSFEDAAERLGEEQIDLILSDVRLRSHQTGIDLARVAREKGIPTLFATGHDLPEAASFAVGRLKKPYSERQLRSALDCVDRHLAGEKVEPPIGLELFAQSQS